MKTVNGPTTAIRKGDQHVPSLAQEDNSESSVKSLPAESILADGSWTPMQRRLLEVLLLRKEYQTKSVRKICAAAGYSGNMAWYQAMKDPHFAAIVQGLGISDWSRPQRRLLEVLQNPENRS